MKFRFKKKACLFLSLIMLLSTIPLGVFSGFASGDDFSAYFTDVVIVQPTGDALPAVVAKDADVRVDMRYQIPGSGLNTGVAYTFTLPTEITAMYDGLDVDIMDGLDKVGIATIGTAGNCTVTFSVDTAVAPNETGNFFIQTTLDKTKISNTTSKISFALGNASAIEQEINFKLDQMSGEVTITNTPSLNVAASQVKWEVVVTPTLKNADAVVDSPAGASAKKLANFTITNQINPQLSLLFNELDVATYPTITKNGGAMASSDYSFSFADGKLNCTLKDSEWAQSDKYTVVYHTSYDLGAFETQDGPVELSNTASASFDYAQYKADSSTTNVTLEGSKTATASQPQAVSVSAKLLSKEESYDKANHNITWTVSVNESAIAFKEKLEVTDQIPAGLQLADSIKLIAHTASGDVPTTLTKNNGYTYTGSDFTGGKLTIPNLDGDKHYTIEYQTQINPDVWKKQPFATYENAVSYKGKYGDGPGYTFSRIIEQTYHFGGGSGGLIGGEGKYDATNHTLAWTISVNSDVTQLDGGRVEISIPQGHTYVDTTLNVSAIAGASGSYDSTAKKITVNLPNGNPTGKILFTTTVDDPNIWATNHEGVEYKVVAKLISETDGIDLTTEPKPVTSSKVIEKSSDLTNGYDFNKKEITWKVTLNQNKMQMTNPVITDTLPVGTEFVYTNTYDDGISATDATVKAVRYDVATRKLEIELNSMTLPVSGQPVLSFKTRITDPAILKWQDASSTSAGITNSASINFDEAPATLSPGSSLTATCSRTVGARPLQKSGVGDAAQRNFTWQVIINANATTLTAPTLIDKLQKNLMLDLESVKLHRVKLADTTGALTPDRTLVYDGTDPERYPEYTASLTGQNFTFYFSQDISETYLLTYQTDNIDPIKATYSNSIQFADALDSSGGESGELIQNSANGGSTNTNRGTIKLLATEADGRTPLKGVHYTITGEKTGFTHTLTTGADGVVWFTPLRFDTFTVTEDLTDVAGYGPLKQPQVFTLKAGENTKQQALPYQKNATMVTLSYDANTTDPVTGTKPSQRFASGAKVPVSANPYIRENYVFDGWNTSAGGDGDDYDPGDELTLTGDITLYAKWHRAQGKITLTARDDQTPAGYFGNLSFTLQPQKAGATAITKTTGANGKVVFDVDLGEYTLVQSPFDRPDGYVPKTIDKTTFHIENDQDTDAVTIIYKAGYALLYDGNGSTGGTAPAAAYFDPNGEVTVIGNKPFTRSGWDFVGWNTNSNGQGTAYAAGEKFNINADTMLYAVWKKQPAPPSYEDDDDDWRPPTGGTPDSSPPTWEQKPSQEIGKAPVKPLKQGTGGLMLSAAARGGRMVPGVTFEIEVDGQKIKVTTDANGVANFPDLAPGRYTVRVVSVPEGYAFDFAEIFEVEVPLANWEGAQAVLTGSPQTGDNDAIGIFWIAGIASLLVCGMSICLFLNRKKGSTQNQKI